ncbi:hypothetical protein NHX12_008991 [Muraenolepis orangiensis]|uniref:Uncharacterized protein n=1 Tax=Muraenolepis orangiensis TaxID=630683 RepID=A0A9Q0DMD4_9TELE|nr:hypothetical protein NHX12_008991 [Muraenolepis orangiensis]
MLHRLVFTLQHSKEEREDLDLKEEEREDLDLKEEQRRRERTWTGRRSRGGERGPGLEGGAEEEREDLDWKEEQRRRERTWT